MLAGGETILIVPVDRIEKLTGSLGMDITNIRDEEDRG